MNVVLHARGEQKPLHSRITLLCTSPCACQFPAQPLVDPPPKRIVFTMALSVVRASSFLDVTRMQHLSAIMDARITALLAFLALHISTLYQILSKLDSSVRFSCWSLEFFKFYFRSSKTCRNTRSAAIGPHCAHQKHQVA
jgi:hypothetical protein